MTEFRPISLCNVSYKIISKILCKRLKKTLPNLISETQSAFMARRQITDNILLAQENFHALRTNNSCRYTFMAMKTDMSKAYDRVEWRFLEAVMKKLGFSEKWVKWLMFCISSVSYQVLINGVPKGRIKPTRGIRQGDPLSPFLFILCTEALISLLKGAEEESRITGLRIAQASPRVSHLLFADDSLFFCKANVLQCAEVLKIIKTYGDASGQQLNPNKSSLIFGNRVDQQIKREIKRTIGITSEGGMGMYLGLPEQICGSKIKVFAYVQDRLNNRINTWSAKFLSKGGKEVLVKSVAQALPTYVMSCFLLPQGITDKLRSAISNFWWRSHQNSRGLHWIAWDKICTSRDSGGLGFRDLREFNLALLAKQLWRLIHFPTSLLARVLRGRYYPQSSPMIDRKARSPSYGWNSIMAAKPLLELGLKKTIHSGYNTKIWSEPWIPDIPARLPRRLDIHIWRDPDLLVKELMLHNSPEWNQTRIRELFHPEDVTLILGLKPSRTFKLDGYAWSYTKSGMYTVKSGYDLLHNTNQGRLHPQQISEPSITGLLSQVWKIKSPGKLRHFMWQALKGCIATCQRLTYRHLGNDKSCPRCGAPEETINHMIFECPPALQVWALSDYPSLPGYFPSTSLYQNMDFLFWRAKEMGLPKPQRDSFPWIIWFIWKARNDKLFNGKNVSPAITLQVAQLEEESWRCAILAREENEEEEGRSTTQIEDPIRPEHPSILTCQVDASWADQGPTSGLRWCFTDSSGLIHTGRQGCRRSLSALHAEFEGLLWAMDCLIQRRVPRVRFETDCSNLLTMIDDPIDWPTFQSELDHFAELRAKFIFFQLDYISRSCNECADALAKAARARNHIFSHVDLDELVDESRLRDVSTNQM